MENKLSKNKKVLISGGGIAGLALAILLKERGWEPLVAELAPGPRTEGYMMDFFGTGWDVAERMGIKEAVEAIRYPIENMGFVNDEGHPYLNLPIERIKASLGGRYTFLRRPDLEHILLEKAASFGIPVRFGISVQNIKEEEADVSVQFSDNSRDSFALVFGADGTHSRVRELLFGPEEQFRRYLGYYVAAFHIENHDYPVGHTFALYETKDRTAGFYPISAKTMSAVYLFRNEDLGFIPREKRYAFVREKCAGMGWISETVLKDHPSSEPMFFDAVTQISLPVWSKGRVALLGDACGCLSLLAGQGSHMALAGAWVLARELERRGGNHEAAFSAYEKFLRPAVEKKQKEAASFARIVVPSARSHPWLRRTVTKLLFNNTMIRYGMSFFGKESALEGYR